jgi:sortase (surface protein transpeptidase)
MRNLAAVAAALVLASGCAANGPLEQAQPRLVVEDPPSSTSTPMPTKPARVADPERIRIKAIGVDAPIDRVGLAEDGSMETPKFGRAGWYTEGPRPGQDGPAVVVAHVDSKTGPDVFARLKELKRGAKIQITDKQGKTYEFVARSKRQTDKDKLPTQAIWGPTDGPALRLITCGGEFDRRSGHYTANITVFADKA